MSWCDQSSCFFSAALIPSIETRSKPTPHRHEPQRFSDFPQGILTKAMSRQEGLISRMFSATQSSIPITHSRRSRISVSTAQQTAEHQLSSDFGTCPNITITEFPSHKNEVSKIHKGSCCQQQGFPAEQSQTSSCSNKHSPALHRASLPGAVTMRARELCWGCHQGPSWGRFQSTSTCSIHSSHKSPFYTPVCTLFQLLSLPQMCHSHDK